LSASSHARWKIPGGLAGFSAQELGGKVVAEAARRAGTDASKLMKRFSATWCRLGLARILRGRRR